MDRLDRACELAEELGLEDQAADLLESYLAAVERAAEAYEGFHWDEEVDDASIVDVAPPPRVLWQLGELIQITYLATKGGEPTHWVHDFTPTKPVLAFDEESQTLHIVGGNYTVTDRGIVG